MNVMNKKAILVDEAFLASQGFMKDSSAPEGINRWKKSDGKEEGPYIVGRSYSFSITLFTGKPSHTLYGIALWTSEYGYIDEKRSFDNRALTIADYEKFVDRRCVDLPEYIRTTAAK